jgi:hypothetical protein
MPVRCYGSYFTCNIFVLGNFLGWTGAKKGWSWKSRPEPGPTESDQEFRSKPDPKPEKVWPRAAQIDLQCCVFTLKKSIAYPSVQTWPRPSCPWPAINICKCNIWDSGVWKKQPWDILKTHKIVPHIFITSIHPTKFFSFTDFQFLMLVGYCFMVPEQVYHNTCHQHEYFMWRNLKERNVHYSRLSHDFMCLKFSSFSFQVNIDWNNF